MKDMDRSKGKESENIFGFKLDAFFFFFFRIGRGFLGVHSFMFWKEVSSILDALKGVDSFNFFIHGFEAGEFGKER